ncbi:hypothetical protein WOLCODRAFT_78651 [Wolfiporia cocos MD-104 SS10]|uniref:Uncharacterized protein n=1 Tax=Wolfiporia cocos (strain MD-104) TaxID=742152 RepID=A0A2H3JFG0_WOLCO|nr:hypothetical protein WOLCODRAFT_78651 [Wolfiporia cocos MD-104 SS10]
MHVSTPGNEAADTLAKAAVTLPIALPPTLTWLRAHAKQSALRRWHLDWVSKNRINSSRYTLNSLPSTTLHPILHHFDEARHTQSRFIQCLTGHAFLDEYYARFVPSESTRCQCDPRRFQTRAHVLLYCPLHEHARHHLRRASPSMQLCTILGTHTGWKALVTFLRRSTAFLKPDVTPIVFDPG